MASVLYDSKAIIPAPLISINKEYRRVGDGDKFGTFYNIVLAGTLLPFRGSPSGTYPTGDPETSFWTLGGYPPDEAYSGGDTPFVQLQRKQEALRWLFKEDGKILEWYGGPAQPVKCRPVVKNIAFETGQWADRVNYSIELEAETLTGISDEDVVGISGLQNISEDWQISEQPGQIGQVYEVSHIVSAKGLLTFDIITGVAIDAWVNAKAWCDTKILGVPDSDFVQYATNFVEWVNGGYTKNTTVSERDGSYAVTETWIIKTAGPGVNAATYFEKTFNLNELAENDTLEVSYNGTVFGLQEGERTGGSLAIANAKNAVPSDSTARSEAQSALSSFLGAYALPASPSQKNISVNNQNGTVNFTFSWKVGEETDYTQTNEATISYDTTDGVYKLSLLVDIEGKGSTKEERATNARNNIPTDIAAFNLAVSIVGSQKPAGVTFTNDFVSKTSVINETKGTARISWAWSDTDENNEEISVEIDYPQIVSAKIMIPGRTAGPIIQRMNTKTAQQITVNYASSGHSSKPDSDTIAETMDTAGGIPDISPWLPGSYILESDRETWNVTTGKYSRSRVHTVTES